MRLLAAPDKFRGTLTAAQAARAIAAGAEGLPWTVREVPLADGGEGTLEALGGGNRSTVVTGPLGEPVEAAWRLQEGVAVVETARASGLALAGGAEANDPVRASTRGTGELIAAALEAGAQRVIVGVGGSATTDGGLGALQVLRPYAPLPVEVACDVETRFVDAAAVYGPQKGATPAQIDELTQRLRELAEDYRREFGIDLETLPRTGAAGGLSGALAALGAVLAPGFELIAEAVGLDAELREADLVVTGEGLLDATSFAGKVVGGVVDHADGRPVLVVAGDVELPAAGALQAVSLVERFGRERALREAGACVAEVVRDELRRRG